MRIPLGRRGLLAATAVAGAVIYWRVRQNRQAAERDWLDDLAMATDEGVAAARSAEPDTEEV